MSHYALSVDIGGTFTDFALFNLREGVITTTHKVLTDAQEPAAGVLRGLHDLIRDIGLETGAIDLMVHSTTLVTNAIIERKGAPTGLITTAGFKDVLEIGAEQIYDIYDLFAPYPDPLIPRSMRLEVVERMTADGEIIDELDPEAVAQLAARLVGQGAKSIAISFLHAYRDSRHEEQAAEIIARRFPEISLSISSRVAPLIGEYERTSTVAADAYVKPVVSRYLNDLVDKIRDLGVTGEPYVMLSSGGSSAVSTAAEYPIRLLESGPAAGAIAARFFGQLAGHDDVLALDMGGTTAKACLIENGRPAIKQWLEVDRAHRFKPGSGLPVMAPTVDLIEIGAGGGSIAWINELDLLKVGPRSASSDPGPVCYGLGGTEPTVTDANLVLGFLGADSFLGGRMRLDAAAAAEAITKSIARPLGLDLVDSAWGIHSIVNENMAAAARLHIIERNRDPRDFTMVASGGAGPAHASAVARLIGCRAILFPLAAGVASALGGLVAPLSFNFTRAFLAGLADLEPQRVEDMYAEMEEEAIRVIGAAGIDGASVTIQRSVDLRFAGQYHELEIPLPPDPFGAGANLQQDLADAFLASYRKKYGRVLADLSIESLNWKVVAEGGGVQLTLGEERIPDDVPCAPTSGSRSVYFPRPTAGFVDCPVYDRAQLSPGMRVTGPAIIEETEATIVIWPGDSASVDGFRTLTVALDV